MATELNATENIKNDFLSSVSHELRTPLTAIKGWAETLSDCGPQDHETLEKGIKVIVNETERLSSMVEELLDFSRIQGGRFQMIMDKTDLLAELGEAVLMFSERAKREKIILQYQEPDSLPTVICDHNRIMQVFVNILDNAIKYSDRGDVVTVRAFAEENNIQVIISDTGCGIPASDLPKVKEKFFKICALNSRVLTIDDLKSSGRLYISSDGGDTWEETQPAGDVDRQWYSIASNSDGSKLITASNNSNIWANFCCSACSAVIE